LCADAVQANSTNWLENTDSHINNCGTGLGYFFYSETEKICRCCNADDASTNLNDTTRGSNLYKLSTDYGIFGKFIYNYTKQEGKCINDAGTRIGGREQDWISHRSCEETCNNDLNCYAF